jgi:hypothetical protein
MGSSTSEEVEKVRRLHAAAGLVAALLFLKILAINMAENLLHQYLGATMGMTVETIALSAAFALILWFVIKK